MSKLPIKDNPDWFEYKPCHYVYIGPYKEPDKAKIDEMIRSVLSKSTTK